MSASPRFRLRELGRLYQLQLDSCTRCGLCVGQCPVYAQLKDVRFTPAYRIQLLKRLAKGKPETRENVADILYQCSVCGVCEQVCGSLIVTPAIWELAREQAVKLDFGIPKHKAFMDRVQRLRNPYGEDPEKRLEWLPKEVKVEERAELGWYVGCTQSYREQQNAIAVAELLKRLGERFTLLGKDEWCCCSPLLRTGWTQIVPEVVKHNVEGFAQRGVKRVLYTCAGCYRTSLIDWPIYYGRKLPFEIVHITTFLYEELVKGKLKPTAYPRKVAWHDPCHIGRHAGIFEEPRKLLQAIPGLQYVELKRSGELSRCCGAGGGVKGGYPDLALKIAKDRLDEAEQAGAEVLATSCPFCLRNFRDAARNFGSKIEIRDLAELILELVS